MIRVEKVNYIYGKGMPDERAALKDVSLEIADGSLTAVIGHTGSGKSTLMQLFNALEKPSSGEVFVNGTEVTAKGANLKNLRQRVGLVFQYPEQQLFEETVYKDIAFGVKNMGFTGAELDERVRAAAKLAGVKEKHLERSPFDLSGGQKRRVAIAGVLAMNPEVLILDEPAAGLDPKGRDSILGVIKALHRERPEMIIIFVSHSMEDVAKTAENVIVMNKGEIAMTGSVEEIFTRAEELEAMGLDVPQITRLCTRLKRSGMDIPSGIFTVEKAVREIYAALNKEVGENA